MSRMDDADLERMLRRCGDELRSRADSIAHDRRTRDVQNAMRGLAEWSETRSNFWAKVRAWVIPMEIAVACAVILFFALSTQRPADRIAKNIVESTGPEVVASSGETNRTESATEADEADSVPTSELGQIYLALNENLASVGAISSEYDGTEDAESEDEAADGFDEDELTTDEDVIEVESLYPQYVSFDVELAADSFEEENVYDDYVYDS